MQFYSQEKDIKEIVSKKDFKKLLYNYAEEKILDHKQRLRQKKLNEINFKLFSEDKYRDKNAFIEFQIET